MKKLFSFCFIILSTLLLLVQGTSSDALSYDSLGNILKSTFQGRDIKAELLKHWQLLDIFTSNGHLNPFIPELLPYEQRLLTPEDPSSYIDRTISCLSKNPYLNKVVSQIKTIDAFSSDQAQLQYLLFSATTYGMALDAFATLARSDYRVLKGSLRHWSMIKLIDIYFHL